MREHICSDSEPGGASNGHRNRATRGVTGAVGTVALTVALVVAGTGVATAHVSVNPGIAVGGSHAELTFRAPNEKTGTNFVKLVLHLPSSKPLSSLSIHGVTGWKVSTTATKLATPIKNGTRTTTDYVADITWTATGDGVAPGQYENFSISGELPTTGSLNFTADQTFTDGSAISWNEIPTAGGAEPAHPAPVVTLTAATPSSQGAGAAATPATSKSNNNGLTLVLAIVALVVALGALVLALLIFRRGRSQPLTPAEPSVRQGAGMV